MNSDEAEIADFAPYFSGIEIDPSRHRAVMDAALQLRYQVYCLECKYLSASDFPNESESDDLDSTSGHFGAFNGDPRLVGYVRLVKADARGEFPFQHHCSALSGNIALPPPGESAEISRLMVHKDYRRRKGDILSGVTVPTEGDPAEQERLKENRKRTPQILLCLYREMYRHSIANNVRYWYAAMEVGLARALEQMGFGFQQIGPTVDYYGSVAPYLADLRSLEQRVHEALPELLAWMRAPRVV